MKINPDCIRDVLLYLEENLYVQIEEKDFSKIEIQQLYDNLPTYSKEDIWYSVYNLHQIKFIDGKINDVTNHKMFFCEIQNITWYGHQFLNTIRPETIWEATKTKAKQMGGMSLHALSTLAMAIANAVVTNPTFIQNIVDKIK